MPILVVRLTFVKKTNVTRDRSVTRPMDSVSAVKVMHWLMVFVNRPCGKLNKTINL